MDGGRRWARGRVAVAVGAVVLLAAAAAAGRVASLPMPSLVIGELVAQGDAEGVPCEIALWQGAIRPLEGRGEPLAVGHARTGGRFVTELTRVPERARRRGWLWATVQCEGYHVRVYAFEWTWLDHVVHPAYEMGRVYVPRRRSLPR